MKHHYESEILYHLMERDGFNIPSSVPPYEAEIKSYLINQVKLGYPKLTDYEAEWLLYNYTSHLPADFPVSSVANVTSATFENVVPFAYQSAILTGQTLVNLSENLQTSTFTLNEWYHNVKLMNNIEKLKRNTYYTVLYRLENISGNHQNYNGISLGIGMNTFNKDLPGITKILDKNGGWCKIKFRLTDELIEQNPTYKHLYIRPIRRFDDPVEGESIDYTIRGFTILEGDYITNPIPFNEVFEGIQSVKLPVLTTTGKNLFDIEKVADINNWVLDKTTAERPYGYYEFSLKPNTTYTFSRKSNVRADEIYACFHTVYGVYNGHGGIIHPTNDNVNKTTVSFTTDSNGKIFLNGFGLRSNFSTFISLIEEAQIEEGSVATTYEPYKTNILSCNEEVTLRGIGEVQDTLDLMTGELTQRIGEVTFDGSENWSKHPISTDEYFVGIIWDPMADVKGGSNTVSDKLTYKHSTNDDSVIYFSARYPLITFHKDSLESMSIESFKKKLSELSPTVQYQLAQEAIKTVDLKTINENGETVYFMPIEGTMNVSCSSETINPTFDMSVPVEATTQNLASFIDLEVEV